MQKSFLVVIGIAVAAMAGYLVFQSSEPATPNDESMTSSTSSASTQPHDNAMMKQDDETIEKSGSMATKDDSMMEKEEPAMKKATYSAYSEGVIGNGETSLLFFHAAWCPACRQGDKDLAAIYSTGTATINTYKVDYDTAATLKAKYGVTTQHTFVLVDGNGTALKTMIGASAAELAAILKK